MFKKIVLGAVAVFVVYSFYHNYQSSTAYWSNAVNNLKVITTDRR